MPIKTHRDEMPTMNLTSMIDVVFLLLIFFMVATRFSEMERRIALEVPQVKEGGALTPAPESKVVDVYRDGTLTLDRQNVTLDELVARLTDARRQYAGLGVLVRGDAQGPFQHVANVLNACKQAGVPELAIGVKIAPEPLRR
jgi:biopolymer transport protein ExbD